MSVEFAIGDRKRFSSFISSLGKGEIASISHTDCDGIGSARVVDLALHPNAMFFADYKDLNPEFLGKIAARKFETVIITDLFFKNKDDLKELSKHSKVLIIDHHSPDVDLNSENIVHLNSQGHCATMIAYDLFSEITNLKEIDWLVACSCAADWQFAKDTEFLTETYKKYGDTFEAVDGELRKSGKIWNWCEDISAGLAYYRGVDLNEGYKEISNTPGNFGNFAKAIKLVNEEIEFFKKKFIKDRKEIPEGYFFELETKYETKGLIVSNLSSKEKNKTLIFATPTKDKVLFSSRRQDGLVDLNKFMFNATEGIGSGGGHKKASGGFVKIENYSEFKRRIGLKN